MKIKLRILIVLLFILLCLPFTAAAENTEDVPYPPRNFLYVVDCSGSMRDYGDALDIGRVMMRDLLPESTTTVIAFSDSAFVTTDKLFFSGETSVLAGIEEANRVLEKQFQEDDVIHDATVLLFSDMQSTVSADDGNVFLTDSLSQEESERLRTIENLWAKRIQEEGLRFYSLRWFAKEPGAYAVTFDPSGQIFDKSRRFEMDSAQEILKTCVEAYACVLTGNDGFQWTEPETLSEGDSMHVEIEKSYRTFLYFPQVPEGVTDPSGHNISPKKWSLSAGGCVLMLEDTKAGTYVFQNTAEGCSILTIPQPQLVVKVSPDSRKCFEKVAISVSMLAGDSYLGYDTGNSLCYLDIYPPEEGELIQTAVATYREEKGGYEFVYTPQWKGEYNVDISYYILGDKGTTIKQRKTFTVDPYEIKLVGDETRAYKDLCQYLQGHILVGSDFSFSLSDYFKTPYRRLEFAIAEPETPRIICWEASSSPEGDVTVHALQEGSALLECSILYYDKDTNQLDHTQNLKFLIQASKPPVPDINWPLVLLMIAAVVGLGSLCLFVLHKKKN